MLLSTDFRSKNSSLLLPCPDIPNLPFYLLFAGSLAGDDLGYSDYLLWGRKIQDWLRYWDSMHIFFGGRFADEHQSIAISGYLWLGSIQCQFIYFFIFFFRIMFLLWCLCHWNEWELFKELTGGRNHFRKNLFHKTVETQLSSSL